MKAVIIGGGVAGLTAARAFLDAGLDVEVYEKRSQEGMLSGTDILTGDGSNNVFPPALTALCAYRLPYVSLV